MPITQVSRLLDDQHPMGFQRALHTGGPQTGSGLDSDPRLSVRSGVDLQPEQIYQQFATG